MTIDNLEILKVANGYVVRPPRDYTSGLTTAHGGMHVFETFDAMVAFIKKTMEPGASDD